VLSIVWTCNGMEHCVAQFAVCCSHTKPGRETRREPEDLFPNFCKTVVTGIGILNDSF
jgi:hypothetical protein